MRATTLFLADSVSVKAPLIVGDLGCWCADWGKVLKTEWLKRNPQCKYVESVPIITTNLWYQLLFWCCFKIAWPKTTKGRGFILVYGSRSGDAHLGEAKAQRQAADMATGTGNWGLTHLQTQAESRETKVEVVSLKALKASGVFSPTRLHWNSSPSWGPNIQILEPMGEFSFWQQHSSLAWNLTIWLILFSVTDNHVYIS